MISWEYQSNICMYYICPLLLEVAFGILQLHWAGGEGEEVGQFESVWLGEQHIAFSVFVEMW